MSNLQYFTALSAIWVALCWVPYILDRMMVRGVIGAMANYDPAAAPQSPWAQRAMRAHNIAVQTFAAFGPLAVMMMILRPDDTTAGTLAMLYFVAILAHYVIYVIGIPVLRTLAFVTASLSTAGMGLRLLGAM